MSRSRRYVVTIGYREPAFDRHCGSGPRARQGSFVVFADGVDTAARKALAEFRRIEALSWVGWSRDVESVSVFPRLVHGGRR